MSEVDAFGAKAAWTTRRQEGDLESGGATVFAQLLWREKWVLLAAVIAMVVLAGVYTAISPKVYQASAIVQVQLPNSNPGTNDTTSSDQALAQNYASLIVSPGFLSSIRGQVDGGKLSVAALQGRLSATALPQSALVELTVTGPSPQAAQTVAGQVIDGFLGSMLVGARRRTDQLEAELQQSISSLSTQITALQARTSSPGVPEEITSLTASRQALITQNASLIANGLAEGTSANLAAAPAAAPDPISPRKSMDLLGGLLLGLVLGVGLAWLRSTLRPRIHSADEVLSLTDATPLGSIPLRAKFNPRDPQLPDAYNVALVNLRFALPSEKHVVVTLAGFNPGVGKTSTVEGLARAAVRSGRRVLMIDGDMRAAALSRRPGCDHHPGLVDYLALATPLENAIVELQPGLSIVPARPSKANPASLLAGPRLAEMLAELRPQYDLILIDTPPMAHLADALLLTAHSDGVALVVRTGVSKPADVTTATTRLRKTGTPLAGLVVFEELTSTPYYGPQTADSDGEVSEDGTPAEDGAWLRL
jgi:succinoglycan biosynthesis transport protein ExoP